MSDIAEEKPVSMPILHDPKPGNQTEAQPNRKQQFEQYNKLGFRFGVMSSSVWLLTGAFRTRIPMGSENTSYKLGLFVGGLSIGVACFLRSQAWNASEAASRIASHLSKKSATIEECNEDKVKLEQNCKNCERAVAALIVACPLVVTCLCWDTILQLGHDQLSAVILNLIWMNYVMRPFHGFRLVVEDWFKALGLTVVDS